MDRRFLLLLLCFLLSGFSALLYQTAWTREFSFIFGTSEIAVAVVLAGYMGGLALGSALAARFAPEVRRPVLVYGALELGIALAALAIPLGMQGLTAAYVALFGHDWPTEPGAMATLFRLVGAFALMLAPTALMGATLPLLARHAVRSDEEIGPRIGALYAVNTFGAIAGTICAGFVLLPALGLRQTVYVGALGNALVFVAAAALARGLPPATEQPASRPAMANTWILPLMLVSGAVSFSYEVLWTRLLSQILGGSLYAFATMLSSFLLGIALGSAAAGALARRAERAALGFVVAELGVAVFAMAAFLAADQLPELGGLLGAGWRGSPLANAPLAAVVLLPVAGCLGATFPFAVRLLTPDPTQSAAATARVYAWNTVGAIAGSIATGFFLIPALHFAGTAVLGAAVSLAIAGVASWRARPRLIGPLGVAVAGAIALAVIPVENPWRLLLTTPFSGPSPRDEKVRYEAAGRSATVVMLERAQGFPLFTNGLPEAQIARYTSTPDRGAEARALGLLPVLLRPDAERMLVVGLGGAAALEGVPPSVESIDVVELEAEVVAANLDAADERARDPLADPRFRIVQNDARGALVLARQRYDAIVSQPSHPWTAGASHLYTREFFELVRDRLEPDGVFVQWIGLRFVDEALLRTLLSTLTSVFGEVQVFRPHGPALLFAASDAPLDIAAGRRAIEESPDHFAELGLLRVEDFASAWMLDTQGARDFAAGAPQNTDDWNLLASRSARLAGGSLDVLKFRGLVAGFDPLPQRASDFDLPTLARVLVRRAEFDRVERLAEVADDSEREIALGWSAGHRGRSTHAEGHFGRALEHDPQSAEAHAALVVMGLPAPPGSPPPPAAALVREALAREAVEDWDGLATMDDALAEIEPGDPLYEVAAHLRGSWRMTPGRTERAEEAIALLDVRLANWYRVGVQIERARAAALAGRSGEAWATLDAALGRLPRGPARSKLLARILALARELPDDPWRETVMARLTGTRGSRPSVR